MRGRTNVTQRKQPVINGQLEQFVVDTGNTITKGDFVSVKFNEEVTQLQMNEIPVEKINVDEENGKFIVFNSSMMYLIQCVGEEIEILDNLSVQYNISKRICYDADLNQLTVYVNDEWCEYTIENDEFVFVKKFDSFAIFQSSGETVSVSDVIAIVPFSDSYFVVFAAHISGARYEYFYCGICDKQFTNRLYKTTSFSYTSFWGCDVVKTTHGNVFVSYKTYYSSNYLNIDYFKVDGANTTKKSLYSTYSSSPIAGYKIEYNGLNIIMHNYSQTSVGVYHFYIDNGDDADVLQFGISHSVSVNSGFCSAKFIDKYTLADIWGDGDNEKYLDIYSVDETLKAITMIQHKVDKSNETSLNTFVKSQAYHFMFKEPQSFYVGFKFLYYANGVYQFGIPTDKVRSYDGASALGFAGSSGNAGDSILVYVPLSN